MQGKKTTIHDKQTFLEALKKRKGIVTLACKEVNLSPMTFYKWLKVDSKFEQEADEIREVEIGIITEEDTAILRKYSGAGGLEKAGEGGRGLLDEYYTPKPIIEKMYFGSLHYKGVW